MQPATGQRSLRQTTAATIRIVTIQTIQNATRPPGARHRTRADA